MKRVSLSSMGRKASRRLPVSLFARVVFHSSSLDSIGKPSSGLTFKNSSLEQLYLKSNAAHIYVVIKRIKEGIAVFSRESCVHITLLARIGSAFRRRTCTKNVRQSSGRETHTRIGSPLGDLSMSEPHTHRGSVEDSRGRGRTMTYLHAVRRLHKGQELKYRCAID